MRIIRYDYNNQIHYGQYKDNQIYPLIGDIFGQFQISEEILAIAAVKLLAPVVPRQLIAIGLNYQDHVGELSFTGETPTEPISFLVAPSAVIGSGESILLNDQQSRIDQEAELAVVIGKPCHRVSEESALDYVLGYTCGNDVSNRDLQRQDGQWFRGKSFPTYKPLGPWLEIELNPNHLTIQGIVNGKIVQHSNTECLIFPVAKLIAFLSGFTTLLPGDVLMTGTPQGVTRLQMGDKVEISIEGIGVLTNYVR